MSNTIKVLINSDGITGRAINPFPKSRLVWDASKKIDKKPYRKAENKAYANFEANVKSYTVIGSCKADDVVEAYLVWRSPSSIGYITTVDRTGYVGEEQAYLIVEAKESKPEKSDDYKQGYVHALDSASENDNLKIKRLELFIEILEDENKLLKNKLSELEAERFELLNNPNHKIT